MLLLDHPGRLSTDIDIIAEPVSYGYLIEAVGENHLTSEEINDFHLSTLKMSYQEAVCEYQRCAATKIGRLIARRGLPVLQHARKIIAALNKGS